MQMTICPGPGYVQEDFEKTPGPELNLIPRRYVSAKFEAIPRHFIVCIIEWAKGNRLLAIDSSQRPTTFGYWVLLRKVSIEFLLQLYMTAIPPEVQLLFENETWAFDYSLCLPSIGHDDTHAISMPTFQLVTLTTITGQWTLILMLGRPSALRNKYKSTTGLQSRKNCHRSTPEAFTTGELVGMVLQAIFDC